MAAGIVEGKILPPAVHAGVNLDDPPIFLLQASPTWAPWLPDGGYQRVPVGSAGQVLTVNADGSIGWSNSSAGFTNPMSTTGDMIYSNPGSTPVALHIGASGTVLTVAGGIPTWTPNSAVGFANPMTTPQDLIVGGTAGAAGRLGVGTNGQVLTVNAGLVSWQNSAAGFSNPMTTTGDLITSNPGATPVRIGAGAANQVLTMSGGLPTWQNSASGFANPMTAAGDMITALNATTATRLPIGATGQVLTVVSGAPAWASGASGASAVVFPSSPADPTGVTDQANISATWTTGILQHGGEVILANGVFYVKPPSGLRCLQPPQQTYVAPQGSTIQGSPVSIRGCGQATIVYPVGAGVTGFWLHRTTSYGAQYGLAAQPQTGYVRDLCIDGSLATGASVGLDYGDGWGYEFDLAVVNFTGTGAIAVNQVNRLSWTEKCDRLRFRLSNNSTAMYITTNGGDHSSEYNMYDISMFAQAGQQGIVVDGMNMGGSYMWIRGNMSQSNGSGPTPPNNIACLSIINAAGIVATDAHRWYNGGIYMKVEANPGNGGGGTTNLPPYCMYSDGVGYVRECVGAINASQLTSSNWNGAEFGFNGSINGDPNLLAAQTGSLVYTHGNANPQYVTVVGAVAASGYLAQFTNTGLSPTGPPVLMQGAQAGDHMLGIQVSGDSNPRWKVDVGGDTLWGSGSAVQDVDLGRNAAGVLLVGGGTANTANIRLGIAGSGRSVLSLAESSSAPGTIASTGILYVNAAGALHYLSPAGTDTQIGPP